MVAQVDFAAAEAAATPIAGNALNLALVQLDSGGASLVLGDGTPVTALTLTASAATTATNATNVTGTVGASATGTTKAAGTNDTTIATTAFVMANAMSAAMTWTNVGGSRVVGTTYTNSTGRPIVVYPKCASYSTVGRTFSVTINGVVFYNFAQNAYTGIDPSIPFVVPDGATYVVNSNAAHAGWYELR